ncbi:MAG: PIG-L deacetylase family protein [Acidimicrobiia bacterium]
MSGTPAEISTDLVAPPVALAIGAHPDDIEFGCGATLAKWAAHGAVVHLLVLTDGSKGSWDESDDLDALIERRHHEAREAAHALGAESVGFLGLVDGELESGARERALVCEFIRQVQPSIVVGHDPWKRYRLHPDHRHAGWLTVDGIVAARDPHFFPGLGGPHHRPDALLLFEADEPDHVEQIDAFLPMKIAALLAHRSQWRSTMHIEAGTPVEAEGRAAFEARIEMQARVDGKLGPGGLAEAFRVITDL